jgi:hypothetical protein
MLRWPRWALILCGLPEALGAQKLIGVQSIEKSVTEAVGALPPLGEIRAVIRVICEKVFGPAD